MKFQNDRNISVVRSQSQIGAAPMKVTPDSFGRSVSYHVIVRRWWQERQHKILILEVIKVACVSTAFILFNEYFYGDFPPSEKVIDDKQVDEGTIVKYDRLLENLLVILLSLSLLFIICTSIMCHIWTLYMPEPLDRYYRKRKTNEPIERDGDQVESYQSSRRQWQYYLVRKSLTSKLGLLPILLPNDKARTDGLENDDCFKWGAHDITNQQQKLDPERDSDDGKCENLSKIGKGNNFLYNNTFEANNAKERVKQMIENNKQAEENNKLWATFYYKWKMLKKFSTKMHWAMLYYDFIVGLFLVLIVLDFNVKSYRKHNIVSVVTGLPDWKFDIEGGTQHVETVVICLHAVSLLCQMIITLYHIKPSTSRIIPDFCFSQSILNKRKAKKKETEGFIGAKIRQVKDIGRHYQDKMCGKVLCCEAKDPNEEDKPGIMDKVKKTCSCCGKEKKVQKSEKLRLESEHSTVDDHKFVCQTCNRSARTSVTTSNLRTTRRQSSAGNVFMNDSRNTIMEEPDTSSIMMSTSPDDDNDTGPNNASIVEAVLARQPKSKVA